MGCGGSSRGIGPAEHSPTLDATRLTLTDLRFGTLPINDARASVQGVDTRTGLCAEIIWSLFAAGRERLRLCDDFAPDSFYVFIGRGDCTAVHYAGNAEVLGARGCIDFAARHADVTVDVRSPLFSGSVIVRTP